MSFSPLCYSLPTLADYSDVTRHDPGCEVKRCLSARLPCVPLNIHLKSLGAMLSPDPKISQRVRFVEELWNSTGPQESSFNDFLLRVWPETLKHRWGYTLLCTPMSSVLEMELYYLASKTNPPTISVDLSEHFDVLNINACIFPRWVDMAGIILRWIYTYSFNLLKIDLRLAGG